MGHRKPFRFQGGRASPMDRQFRSQPGTRAVRPYRSRENTDFQGEKNLGKSHQDIRSQLEMSKPQHSHKLLSTLSE